MADAANAPRPGLDPAPMVAVPGNPLPADGYACWLNAADGTRLRAARWPRANAPRGSIIVLGGRTEFIEKTADIIQWLLDLGFDVAALDWRGQGLSDRPLPDPHKGDVRDFSDFLLDLDALLAAFPDLSGKGAPALLAHSMGGHIAVRYAAARPGKIGRYILSSPMLGLSPGFPDWVLRLITAAGGFFMPTAYVPGGGPYGPRQENFDLNVVTSDPARFQVQVDLIRAEPKLALGDPTYRWLKGALASLDLLAAPGFAEAITAPMLICGAGRDLVVSTAAAEALCARLPNGKFVRVPGARHEILRETDDKRAVFFAATKDFLSINH